MSTSPIVSQNEYDHLLTNDEKVNGLFIYKAYTDEGFVDIRQLTVAGVEGNINTVGSGTCGIAGIAIIRATRIASDINGENKIRAKLEMDTQEFEYQSQQSTFPTFVEAIRQVSKLVETGLL